MTPPLSHLLAPSLHVAELVRSRDFYRRVFERPLLLEDDRRVALGLPGPVVVVVLSRHGGSTPPSPVPRWHHPAA
jgi:catechol-2,3-dioxygenase